MASLAGGTEPRSPNLDLTQEEQRLYTQIFSAADTEGIGVVTGDVALRFLPERTKLPSEALGEIWQIADTDDKGFLTPSGFYIVLRLIGYAQAGRTVSGDLALKPGGPLPKLDGINSNAQPPASPLQAQASGGPVKVPPLTPDKAGQYAMLFQQSGAQDGLLPGTTAKQIFDRAQLPNDVLVRIWNLADTEQRGKLSTTEFIVAMHLLASYRSGAMRALPRNLPAGLWDAAARRNTNQRPPSSGGPPAAAIPRQFSGPTTPRTSSPLAARPPYTSSQAPVNSHSTGDWAVTAQEKAQFDAQFAKLDTQGLGYINGEQAASFFGNSRLPEDDLAQVWDLADTKSQGQLNAEEFAIAMHLIRNRLQNRTPIPSTLPPELVPPTMRQSQSRPAPPAAAQSTPQKPKSAAEDLFGLDALADPPPAQAPQTTGGSSAAAAPARPATSSSTAPAAQQSTVFKPFVPSSSFGQSIVSPQATGASSSSQPTQAQPQQQARDLNDDLLGDADPEVSKRLTNETTELANLSTQVGNLTNQMQDVKSKRTAADGNLSSVTKQKQEFEARLAQLRSAYEQEAREVRALEEKLNTSRSESKKAQADLAMVQHTYNTLQEQKQQLSDALEADKQENANLKERMRQVNEEITQIKPQIEKIKSEARQQKGLVAIHKKQLNGNETERDKLKSELTGATQEHEEATRELEETKETLQRRGTSPAAGTPPVASPSSQSTNPFFRRTTTGGSADRGVASPPAAEETASSPNHSAFDSFFGSSFPAAGNVSQAPPVSFGTPAAHESVESTPAISESRSTPMESSEPHTPTQSSTDLPSSSQQAPPPPPQSRQITSSSLPFRETLQRPASPSSSVGVAPPASRFGDGSGYNTPVHARQASQTAFSTASETVPMSPLNRSHQVDSSPESSPVAAKGEGAVEDAVSSREVHPASATSIPGAFPGDTTPPVGSTGSVVGSATGAPTESKSTEDPFGISGISRTGSAKDDFDSAFAGFEHDKGKAPMLAGATAATAATAAAAAVAGSKPKDEFPPIQEFGDDSDSDSDSGKGFDDDFTATSFTQKASLSTGDARPAPLRDLSQNNSELPTPNAEKSPPTYNESVPAQNKIRTGSNQFPAEYNGLLPSREEPISAEDTVSSPVQQTSAGIAPMSTPPPKGASNAAVPPPPPPKAPRGGNDAFDDFDTAFGDLSEAQTADEKGDEHFGSSHHGEFGDDVFNPTFDSPAASKIGASSMFGGTDSTFDTFEASASGTSATAAAAGAAGTGAVSGTSAGTAPITASDSEWDQMFASLDSAAPAGSSSQAGAGANGMLNPSAAAPSDKDRPPLGRALSEGTEHDDPILKRLTAMGYPRDQSLKALEKFDYNLDKAADYLTQQ